MAHLNLFSYVHRLTLLANNVINVCNSQATSTPSPLGGDSECVWSGLGSSFIHTPTLVRGTVSLSSGIYITIKASVACDVLTVALYA